jgi:hypothetical protein
MADAKIEIKVSAVSFSGEGEGKWLSEQLDKVIEKLPQLANVAPAEPAPENDDEVKNGTQTRAKKRKIGTLASFLQEKKATDNQVRKFLATALWLHDRDGEKRITTSGVKKALKSNNQGKLSNASASLNQNVSKGFCEKDGKGFFVTDAGRTSLG